MTYTHVVASSVKVWFCVQIWKLFVNRAVCCHSTCCWLVGWLDCWPLNPQWYRGHHYQGCPWQVLASFPLYSRLSLLTTLPNTLNPLSRAPFRTAELFQSFPSIRPWHWDLIFVVNSVGHVASASTPFSWRLPHNFWNDIKYKVLALLHPPFPSRHFYPVSHFSLLLPCTRFPPNVWKGSPTFPWPGHNIS